MRNILYDTPFHLFARLILWIYFKLLYGIRIQGRENIPLEGPVLIAPNHASFYDPPLAGFPAPRPIYFMSNKKYMDIPLLGLLMRALRAFPIENQNDRAAYARILRTLKAGKCLTIFPEGTRSRDGRLGAIQSGVPRIALKTGAAIVPLSIVGVHEVWPPGQKLPSIFKKIRLKYHRPIRVAVCENKDELKTRTEEIRLRLERVLDRRLRAWERLRSRKKSR